MDMPTGQISQAVQHLRRAVLWRDGAGLSDGQLLEHFIERRDEAAFETLVRRHGPMVLGVCRRLLRNYHDADDAFQATFLVLVRKAASVAPREMVGNWLYGVAYQTALKGRAVAAKRRARERQVTEMPEPPSGPRRDVQQTTWQELQWVLDQELSRLPNKYRIPFVLCDLEGKSYKEAARQLGWPEGTLSVRLARARQMLAKRLTRQGISITGAALATVLSEKAASASVPPSMISSTIKAAGLLAAGQVAAAGVVSGEVAALTKGVLKAMLLSKVKTAMAVILTMSLVGLGGGAVSYYALAGEETGSKGQEEKSSSAGKRVDDGASKKNPQQTDKEKLQGVWKPVKLETVGRVFGEAKIKDFGDLVINGDRLYNPGPGVPAPYYLHWHFGEGDYACEIKRWWGTYELDTGKRPKRISITLHDAYSGENKWNGIYSIDGDKLRLCLNETDKDASFPSEFKTKDRSPSVFVTYNREKTVAEQLLGEWVGKDPDGTAIGLVFGQKNYSQLDADDGRHFRGTYTIDFSQTPYHLDLHWTEPIGRFRTGKFRTLIEFVDEGELRIETTTEDKPRPKKFTENSLVLTRRRSLVGEAAKSDKEAMQGQWQLIDGEVDGEKIDVEGFGLVTVHGDIMNLPFGEISPVSFKLDAVKKPKRITIIVKSLGTDAKMNGIYALDGDQLKLCFANKGEDNPPPKDFVAKQGSAHRLFILKRVRAQTIQSQPEKSSGQNTYIDKNQTKANPAGTDAPRKFERFHQGGFQSMRGFEFRGVDNADEKRFRQYQVECTLVQADPKGKDLGADGKGKILSNPVLMVLEGKEAKILSGGEQAVPGDKDNEVEFVDFGVSVRVKAIGLSDGSVRLETVLESSEVESADPKGALIRSKNVRSIARVKLGEAIKLVEKDDQGEARHWVRVKVVKEESVVSRSRSTKADSNKRPTFQEVAQRLGLSDMSQFMFREAVYGYLENRDSVPSISDLARDSGLKEIDVYLLIEALRRDAADKPDKAKPKDGKDTKRDQSGLNYRLPSGVPIAIDFGFPVQKAEKRNEFHGPNSNSFKTGGDFMFLNSQEYQIPVRASDEQPFQFWTGFFGH
jgi:RNA polymerase sigma factor (sigma-70 family)